MSRRSSIMNRTFTQGILIVLILGSLQDIVVESARGSIRRPLKSSTHSDPPDYDPNTGGSSSIPALSNNVIFTQQNSETPQTQIASESQSDAIASLLANGSLSDGDQKQAIENLASAILLHEQAIEVLANMTEAQGSTHEQDMQELKQWHEKQMQEQLQQIDGVLQQMHNSAMYGSYKGLSSGDMTEMDDSSAEPRFEVVDTFRPEISVPLI